MKIEIIYIPCFRGDFRLTRICVASIRYWYPDIPIVLVKDLMNGNFDTSEIEKHFNVSIFKQNAKAYGWGFSKFEVFLEEDRKRFLMLDSDIVLIGPLLDLLEKYDEDWIVHKEPFTQEDLYRWYFDPEKIKKIDPNFNFPNFTFNTGQLVGITGILKREDFNKFIEWSEPRIQLYREAFTFGGEQPLLNYLLMKKTDKKQITLRRLDFMREGLHIDTHKVNIDNIKNKKGYPFIIHWHDGKPEMMNPFMKKFPRNDILLFFENNYYRGAGVSKMEQYLRIRYEYFFDTIRKTLRKFLSKNKRIKNLFKNIAIKYGERLKI